MFEDGPTECERCGGQLRRVIHPTGIIFKGGGFYKTDSRSSSSGSVGGSSRGGSAGKSGEGAPAGSQAETRTSDTGSAPTAHGRAGKNKGDGGGD